MKRVNEVEPSSDQTHAHTHGTHTGDVRVASLIIFAPVQDSNHVRSPARTADAPLNPHPWP